nr:sigma-70 family RNA polymerase sigma factor [Paenibacillus sp. HB172176]
MEALIKKAKRGDANAYMELFSSYEEDIYRMAYVYVKNENDALDIVQETAYRSYKAIAKLKNAAYFKTWLIRITIHCAVDLLRQRNKTKLLTPDQITDTGSEANVSLSLTLQQLLSLVHEDEKSVILLHYYQDYTIKQTAEILGIPLGTAKTTLYRVLSKLRAAMKEEDRYEQ